MAISKIIIISIIVTSLLATYCATAYKVLFNEIPAKNNNFMESKDILSLHRNITDVEYDYGQNYKDLCDCHFSTSYNPWGLITTYDSYWLEIGLTISGVDAYIGTEYFSGNFEIFVIITGLYTPGTYIFFSFTEFEVTDASILPTIEGAVFSVLYADDPTNADAGVASLNSTFVAWFNDNSVEIGKAYSEATINGDDPGNNFLTIPLFFIGCAENNC